MKALQIDKQGLAQVITLPDVGRLEGIHRTTETTEINGWGDLDGTARVYAADSGAYEVLIPSG